MEEQSAGIIDFENVTAISGLATRVALVGSGVGFRLRRTVSGTGTRIAVVLRRRLRELLHLQRCLFRLRRRAQPIERG